MIGYLRGEVLENHEGKILMGVGGAQGLIGYQVSVPQNATYAVLRAGGLLDLFIYTHVREDSLDLFGFATHLEKALFLLLLSVNGIGPKSALGILSAAGPKNLISAIVRGDQKTLTAMPGVGKKTAERVVVELRDVIQKKVDSGVLSLEGTASLAGISSELVGHEVVKALPVASAAGVTPSVLRPEVYRDARDALVGLGYREFEIETWMGRALEKFEVPPQKAEDLIKSVLRNMG